MSKQDTVELTKIRKALEKEYKPKVKKLRKKIKKAKLSDLLDAESINERIRAFMDKLTLDDAIKGSVFIAAVYLIYPFIYKMKPRSFWERFALKGDLMKSFGWFFIGPLITKDEPVTMELDILAISMIVSYIAIYQGQEIFSLARSVVGALGA